MSILERCLSTDESDQLMSEKSLDSATELLHDSILSCSDCLEVETVCQTCDSESLSLTKTVQHLGILAERLGRNAAFVQTCASDVTGLNQHNLDSPLGSQQGGLITARACTYNYDLHIYNITSLRISKPAGGQLWFHQDDGQVLCEALSSMTQGQRSPRQRCVS